MRTATTTKPIRIGIIGAGMAGQAHAFGYRNAMMGAGVPSITLETIADPNLPLAQSVADRYGFARATGSIDDLLDSDVDVVSVALPNFLHAEILSKVLASGKHVFAEKPIGRTVAESAQLQALAEASTAVTGVGFSFRRLPGLAAIAQLVHEGEIGEIHTFRAWYYADYAADPSGPLSWRFSHEQAGGGALLDIGAHAIDAVQFVAGNVSEVVAATLKTVYSERPQAGSGRPGPVTNDDIALLQVRLENSAIGQISLSRVAHGMPNSLGVEVYGTTGHAIFDSISASQFYLFRADDDSRGNGPHRVFIGPAHPYFNDVAAMPGAGVGTGYAEAFVAEIQEFLRHVKTGEPMDTDFMTATRMMRVVDAALASDRVKASISVRARG